MASIHDPQTVEQVKAGLDAVSVVTVLGALAGILPAIAALFTIVWTALRIWESRTVQEWRSRKQQREE